MNDSWEITETSVPAQATARFIPRSSHKTNHRSFAPTLMLTGQHHLVVLGSENNSSTDNQNNGNNNSTDNNNNTPKIKESPVLQWTSRPGTATAFSSSDSAIPALYDPKSRQVYALQNGNHKLSCWDSSTTSDCTLLAQFDSPVVTLELVREPTTGTTLVYGSCQNSQVFWVHVRTRAVTVSEITTNEDMQEEESPKRTVVATLARPSTISKRKHQHHHSSTTPHCTTMVIQQIVVDEDQSWYRISHLVPLHKTAPNNNTTTIATVPTERKTERISLLERTNDDDDESTQFVGTSDDDQLVFCTKTSTRQYCTLVRMDNATNQCIRVPLPLDTQHVKCLGPHLLAVGTLSHLLVVDVRYGATIHYEPLPFSATLQQPSYSLVTDRRRKLAVVGWGHNDKKKGLVYVAVPAAGGSLFSKLATSKTTMAASLAASLGNHPKDATIGCRQRRSLTMETTSVPMSKQEEEEEEEAIQLLMQASLVKNGSAKVSLLDAFQKALDLLHNNNNNNNNAPLKTNGKHRPKKKTRKTLVNGASSLSYENDDDDSSATEQLPLSLVDCAAPLAVRWLCHSGNSRDEASQLLQRLLPSRKVLAREHLVPQPGQLDSFGRLLESLSKTTATYTAMDLVMDMLAYCPDVSERQMVLALHHVFCKTSPEDIATYFAKNDKDDKARYQLSQEYTAAALKQNGASSTNDLVQKLSSQLILSASRLLLSRILSYSPCNDTLLRVALDEVLHRSEMGLLARLLADGSCRAVTTTTQWLSALCDCLRGEPADSLLLQTVVPRMRQRVATELSLVQSVLALERFVAQDDDKEEDAENEPTEETTAMSPAKKKAPQHLPSYQIEPLVF